MHLNSDSTHSKFTKNEEFNDQKVFVDGMYKKIVE